MKVQVQVISFSPDLQHAEIVLKDVGTSVTRHVVRENDGEYHWRKNAAGEKIHEVYKLT